MADIANFLKDYLLSKNDVKELVGNRIFNDAIDPGAQSPLIRIEVFKGSSASHLGGITGVASNRIQIDTYGSNSRLAHQLSEIVRLCPLQGFRGTMGSDGLTLHVLEVTTDDGYDRGYDKPIRGAVTREGRYFISRDYDIYYREATRKEVKTLPPPP